MNNSNNQIYLALLLWTSKCQLLINSSFNDPDSTWLTHGVGQGSSPCLALSRCQTQGSVFFFSPAPQHVFPARDGAGTPLWKHGRGTFTSIPGRCRGGTCMLCYPSRSSVVFSCVRYCKVGGRGVCLWGWCLQSPRWMLGLYPCLHFDKS